MNWNSTGKAMFGKTKKP